MPANPLTPATPGRLTREQMRNAVSLAMKRARDGMSYENVRGDILQLLDPVYQSLAAEGETPPAVPSPEMPAILKGDLVELDGFGLRDVLDAEAARVIQGSDGVLTILRPIWRRP